MRAEYAKSLVNKIQETPFELVPVSIEMMGYFFTQVIVEDNFSSTSQFFSRNKKSYIMVNITVEKMSYVGEIQVKSTKVDMLERECKDKIITFFQNNVKFKNLD